MVIVIWIDDAGKVTAVTEQKTIDLVGGGSHAYPIAKDIVKSVPTGGPSTFPIANLPLKGYLAGLIRNSPYLTREEQDEAIRRLRAVGPGVPVIVREGNPGMIHQGGDGVPSAPSNLIQRYVDP